MKLKTLKDLDFNEAVKPNNDYSNRKEFIKFKLRQEAIKWYKDIKASQPYQELSGPDAVQMWINIFFNLKWVKKNNLNIK